MPKQNATDKKQNSRKRTSASPARPQTRLDAQAQASNGKFLDEYAKRDMAGVVFIVAAVILMLFAIFSPDGTILGGVANYGLHHAFGVGSYILPFVLLVVGITFLFKTNNRRISLRASLGLGIIYLALLAFIALFTPIANLGVDDADLLLAESAVVSHGGYVGAGIAWVGVTLFGKIVTGVILVGIMLIGAIIIGFSISKLLDQIRKAAKIRAVTKKNADQSFAQNAEGVTGTPMRQPKIQLFKQKGLSEAVLDAQDDTSLSTQKTQTLGFAPRHNKGK
jgi:S-DNA-T family DNA segregation ATPase FtsK/SpoIIIE